jgi:hypothetical protein
LSPLCNASSLVTGFQSIEGNTLSSPSQVTISEEKNDLRSALYSVPLTVGSPNKVIVELVTTNFLTPAFSACRKTFKEPSMAAYQKKKQFASFKKK